MSDEQNEVVCTECGFICDAEDVLSGKHPFIDGCVCYGCPSCKEIETMMSLDKVGE